MSHKLEKPCTQTQRNDFIVEYNHNLSLEIVETDSAIYALEKNEILIDDIVEIDPDFEQKQAQKERERISKLKVTKRVFALSLQQFGITYTQLKELIATNEQAQLEWDLCVELERSNPLLDVMASQMGITSKQLDEIFIEANKHA